MLSSWLDAAFLGMELWHDVGLREGCFAVETGVGFRFWFCSRVVLGRERYGLACGAFVEGLAVQGRARLACVCVLVDWRGGA